MTQRQLGPFYLIIHQLYFLTLHTNQSYKLSHTTYKNNTQRNLIFCANAKTEVSLKITYLTQTKRSQVREIAVLALLLESRRGMAGRVFQFSDGGKFYSRTIWKLRLLYDAITDRRPGCFSAFSADAVLRFSRKHRARYYGGFSLDTFGFCRLKNHNRELCHQALSLAI